MKGWAAQATCGVRHRQCYRCRKNRRKSRVSRDLHPINDLVGAAPPPTTAPASRHDFDGGRLVPSSHAFTARSQDGHAMLGQAKSDYRRSRVRRASSPSRRPWRRSLGIECALGRARSEASLRFAWGSSVPSPQKWTGSITVSDGELTDLSSPSASKPMKRRRSASATVRPRHAAGPAARSTVSTSRSARTRPRSVTIDLRRLPDAPAKPIEFTLAELTQKQQRALDELGGFLIVCSGAGRRCSESNSTAPTYVRARRIVPADGSPANGRRPWRPRNARGQTLSPPLIRSPLADDHSHTIPSQGLVAVLS